jgi:prevent-host-death family protein
MAETVNIHAAKTQFSKLLKRVAQGEEFVIANHGKPVARLSPEISGKRVPGRFADTPPIPDAVFFGPLDEDEQALWEKHVEPRK